MSTVKITPERIYEVVRAPLITAWVTPRDAA